MAFMAAVLVALVGCGDGQVTTDEPLAGVPGTPFSDGGSWLYSYVTADPELGYPATTFSDLAELVTSGDLTDRGITNIMVYGPYASTAQWRGLPPTGDFTDIDPANGTLADWREMVSEANSRGITVTIYIALLYLDTASPLFEKAQQDRAAGTSSWESGLLLWDPRTSEDGEPFPGPPPKNLVPRPDNGGWAFSEIAQEWYATAWDLPALYYGNDSTMEFAKSVMRYWMDNGVQGFELDAPHTMWGFDGLGDGGEGEARHSELVRYPGVYRPQLQTYTMAEGVGTFDRAEWLDRIGYTHVMLNYDDDGDSFVQQVVRGDLTVEQLDAHYRDVIDARRDVGRGSYAPMLYVSDFEPGRLAQDVAVQGGSGAIVAFDQQEHLGVLDKATLDSLEEVTQALAASPAEAPRASRDLLPTTSEGPAYAIVRVSADGERVAVNVYNLTGEPAQVAVDVTSVLADGAELTDLRDPSSTAEVSGQALTLDMDAWGWTFLEGPASVLSSSSGA